MSQLIPLGASRQVTVPSGESIAVFTQGKASVSTQVGFPNYPNSVVTQQDVINGQVVYGPFTANTLVFINGDGANDVLFEVGSAPIVKQWRAPSFERTTVTNIADGGSMAVTAAGILGGIVTATPTAGRNIQLPTGAAMDLSSEFNVSEGIEWSVITLAAFALTLTVNTGHTIVGAAATAGTSGAAARFRTVKTAADTFVTYRLS